MVSSTGTFVSCKDYDEDIDRIDKELVDIKSALSALQAKVDAGKYVTNVVKNGDGITVTWSDNSTSTIETIKGDKGEDGKNGTVVTIIDGYWAFDGVKSEYPAKGDKGDKGDQGEPGDAAAAGHDAKISENGYWMVWDTEKAAYVETEYIAGGAVAAQVKGGWNITVKDENGDEQTIFIPSSATMGYMDVLNGANPMHALYGINEKDVEYGPAKKTLKKGLYTTLDRDLEVVVNPQGTFTSNNVTREVVLTDADFTLVDALDDTFYLFDGVKADGNVDKRSDMNLRQGFEEGTEGFATNFTLANANASAYYYKNGKKFAIPVSVGTVNTNAKFVTNANTKTRAWEPGTISATNVIVTDLGANEAVKSEGYAAVPGGIMIQLPSSIGTTEPVTIEFKLKDVFGVTKTLKVVVKAAK